MLVGLLTRAGQIAEYQSRASLKLTDNNVLDFTQSIYQFEVHRVNSSRFHNYCEMRPAFNVTLLAYLYIANAKTVEVPLAPQITQQQSHCYERQGETKY
jgi:hypothetical protein